VRLLNLDGRLHVSTPDGLVDVAAAGRGQFSGDPQEAYDRWEELVAWSESSTDVLTPTGTGDVDPARLGAPTPRPRQVFAVGLNYADHAGHLHQVRLGDLRPGHDGVPAARVGGLGGRTRGRDGPRRS
jgi:2-keto-4-pentenoate hydratase/2-oxohepta-3-ene-1,7-dioic acid hydratase in catechol pathway